MSYEIARGRAFDDEVDRIFGEEARAIPATLDAGRRRRDRGVHQTRKHIKKLRGLLRLVRCCDEDFYSHRNRQLGELGRSLSAGRDATAMIESLDRLAKAGGSALPALRERLVRRRDEIVHNDAAHVDAIETVSVEFRELESAIEHRVRAADAGFTPGEVVKLGLSASWRRARKAYERARKDGAEDDFHTLRKAAKVHLFHLTLLKPFWPKPFKPRRDAANKLGDLLGELNDIAVMRLWLSTEDGVEQEQETLRAIIARTEKRLRRDSLAIAKQLFERKPESVSAKVARAVNASQPRPKKGRQVEIRQAA